MTSGVAEPYFLDTNVLVYANIVQAPLHQLARETIQRLDDAGHNLWISRQIIREYLATVTRPQPFASPMAVPVAINRVRYFLRRFAVAEDTAETTEQLLTMLEQIPTGGSQMHDANIVATMQVYGVRQILTHNTHDFARFGHLITVVPLEPTP